MKKALTCIPSFQTHNRPQLQQLGQLPKLRVLEMAFPGQGSLSALSAVTQLTSMSLTRSQDAAGGDAAIPHAPLPAAAPHLGLVQPPVPAAAVHAPDGAAAAADGAEDDYPPLPAVLGKLQLLQSLCLENLPPNYEVLRSLPALRQLEMRVSGGDE